MFKPLAVMLSRAVTDGDLTLIDSRAARYRFGDGRGLPIVIRLADRKLERDLVLDPHLALGEAYMTGRLTLETGSLYQFLDLIARNIDANPLPRWARLFSGIRHATRRVAQFNPVARSRANVAHHYDITGAIYDLFLDKDRQYSCAYFRDGDGRTGDCDDLDAAQHDKKSRLAAKLLLLPEHHVLDIGCGWGGLALHLARTAGCEVTGITLSREQHRFAVARAAREGLTRAVHFNLQDYRQCQGQFDRIISVGMFEHVGINHYGAFFDRIRSLLKGDGVALIHTIGRSDKPTFTDPFIAKYIFPGGYIPSLSEILPAIERSGLVLSDVEILRAHYARTLCLWRQRFMANRVKAAELLGEDFCRMWEYYLAGSEVSFRHQHLVVFQLQLIGNVDALPITRDYMADWVNSADRMRHGGRAELPLAGE